MDWGAMAQAANQAINGTVGLGFGIWDRVQSQKNEDRNFSAWNANESANRDAQTRINESNLANARLINQQNIDFQNQTNLRNEELMREGWSREDNAVQRRTDDLRAAGINPILAAGQAAQSGQPVNVGAPRADMLPSGEAYVSRHRDRQVFALAPVIGQFLNSQQQAGRTFTETALLNEQLRGASIENANRDAMLKERLEFLRQHNRLTSGQADSIEQEYNRRKRVLNRWYSGNKWPEDLDMTASTQNWFKIIIQALMAAGGMM